MTVDLSYAVHGPDAAPVAVLLHGMGEESHRGSWDAVVPLLEDEYRVIVTELRGHGRSPRPGSYLMSEMADDVGALLDGLGVGKATVIGHSMGGIVAMVLAVRRPDLVGRLVVEDSPPPRATPVPGFFAPPPLPPNPTEYDKVTRPAILRELDGASPAWAQGVDEIGVPVLVMGGGPTSEIDQEALEALARRLPRGTWTSIDVGHNIHPNRPEEFVAAVREWAARIG